MLSIRQRRGGCRSACRAPGYRSSGSRACRDRPCPFNEGAVFHRRVLDRHQLGQARGDDKAATCCDRCAESRSARPRGRAPGASAVLGSSPASRTRRSAIPHSTSPTPCRRARRRHRPKDPRPCRPRGSRCGCGSRSPWRRARRGRGRISRRCYWMTSSRRHARNRRRYGPAPARPDEALEQHVDPGGSTAVMPRQ